MGIVIKQSPIYIFISKEHSFQVTSTVIKTFASS